MIKLKQNKDMHIKHERKENSLLKNKNMRFITIRLQAEIFLSYVLITQMRKIIAAINPISLKTARFTLFLIALKNNL